MAHGSRITSGPDVTDASKGPPTGGSRLDGSQGLSPDITSSTPTERQSNAGLFLDALTDSSQRLSDHDCHDEKKEKEKQQQGSQRPPRVQWQAPTESKQFDPNVTPPRTDYNKNAGVEIEIEHYYVQVRKGVTFETLKGTHNAVVKRDGFELQAELSGKLEFVTDTPHKIPGDAPKGLQDAVTALAELAKALREATATGSHRAYGGQAPLTDPQYSVFYDNTEGTKNDSFKGSLQATIGTQLATIGKLLRTWDKIGASTLNSGALDLAVRNADKVVKNSIGNYTGTSYGTISPELEGLLVVIFYYLALSAPDGPPTMSEDSPKGRTDLMARTNFVKMFSMVPEAGRLGADDFVKMVLGDKPGDTLVFNQYYDSRPIPTGTDLTLWRNWPPQLQPEDTGTMNSLFTQWSWDENGSIHGAFKVWNKYRNNPGDVPWNKRKTFEAADRFSPAFRLLLDRTKANSTTENFLGALDDLHKAGKPLEFLRFHPKFRITIPVTRAEWLRAMTSGEDKIKSPGDDHILKTMGALDTTDDLGAAGDTNRGAVFELRKFAKELPPEEWPAFVEKLQTYLAQLNAKMTADDREKAEAELRYLQSFAKSAKARSYIGALIESVEKTVFREQAWALIRRANYILEADWSRTL
jgi:hypothetical protein